MNWSLWTVLCYWALINLIYDHKSRKIMPPQNINLPLYLSCKSAQKWPPIFCKKYILKGERLKKKGYMETLQKVRSETVAGLRSEHGLWVPMTSYWQHSALLTFTHPSTESLVFYSSIQYDCDNIYIYIKVLLISLHPFLFWSGLKLVCTSKI